MTPGMKPKLFFLIFIVVLVGLLYQSACKRAWDFNILGTWEFTINTSLAWNLSFTEVLTFRGSIDSGMVYGWAYDPGEIGNYNVVSGSSVGIIFHYYCICGAEVEWTFNANASETDENFLEGIGAGSHIPGDTWTITWSAVRL